MMRSAASRMLVCSMCSMATASACTKPTPPAGPIAGSNDAAFSKLAADVLEDTYAFDSGKGF